MAHAARKSAGLGGTRIDDFVQLPYAGDASVVSLFLPDCDQWVSEVGPRGRAALQEGIPAADSVIPAVAPSHPAMRSCLASSFDAHDRPSALYQGAH